MNALLAVLVLGLGVGISFFVPDYGAPAVLVGIGFACFVGYFIRQVKIDNRFLTQLFVAAFLIRVAVGTVIFTLGIQEFFGADAITYDALGYQQLQAWQGGDPYFVNTYNNTVGWGWGMNYIVAAVYGLVGRNTLAVQFVNAVMGAATAPVIFLCAHHLFGNLRVARLSGLFVAFYPSIVLWSSQGLKDGPVVFLITVSMLAALKVSERFSFRYAIVLACALFGIMSLRFYIFYMVVAAILGALIVGTRALKSQSLARQFVVVAAVGVALVYLGVSRSASEDLGAFGNLEAVQRSRFDLAQSAQSGFAAEADVSTASGAMRVIPVGMVYLLFAPFPWHYDVTNVRQSITLPEMIVWWAAFPLLVVGLWFVVRYRLRQALPILLFVGMLTISYSVFQGNVGTAYRQRSQLFVFYFIFVAVGAALLKERSEDQRRQAFVARQAVPLRHRRPSRVS